MRYLAGYVGCAVIFVLLMGMVFKSLVLPPIFARKKRFIEWLVILVFGFGMLRGMAVKPGAGDALQGPRRTPTQQTAEPHGASEGAAVTNAPPWEHALSFSQIETSPSNVLLNVAWPSGLYGHAPVFDLFIAQPGLTNDWCWITTQAAAATDTNCLFTVTPALLGLAELPSALFARVTERNAACAGMGDFDNDGVPNLYELHYGTNPYILDAYRIQTLDCTNTNLSTLKTILSNSTDYSMINLPTGTIDAAESIVMPPHPVLLSGPPNGYTVIKSTAGLGAFMFKDGQDSHTLVRNIYLDLLKRDNFQVGFWSGGNLPWEGVGASPSFENIVIRMPRPEPLYIGWLFYGDNGVRTTLSNCALNALGATNVRGVETGNGPHVDLIDCSFLNFPSNGIPILPRTFTLGNNGITNTIARQGSEATVFIDLTPGIDSDGDGYTNDYEARILGTDPWLHDTDGDGVPDAEEISMGTDPTDVQSFRQTIFIHVTNGTDIATSAVYVSWRCEDDVGVSMPITNSTARSFDISIPRPEAHSQIYIHAFHDMDRDGVFDGDFDIELTKPVAFFGEVSYISFAFGDVDGDHINDRQERLDGSDPYSANSLRITRNVRLEDKDITFGITNYVSVGLTNEWREDEPFHRMSGQSETVPIATNAINGCVFVKCYRDFNKNGVFDADSEPLYVFSVGNETASSKGTLSAILRDKDNDGVPDSEEWNESTNLNSPQCYCYSPRITVTGIFSTTNQLLAQPFFGTNALAAAHVVNTNQEEYSFFHLSTIKSERLTIKYWDDLNDNLVYDEGEPLTTATVKPNGHETSLIYDLPYSKFDANNNRLPDWWEVSTGLSTNAVPYDYYTDTDNDGLINLHEYWTGCDPITPDGSNTVLSILARSIDDRLTDDPTGRMNVYNNYCEPDFYPNTNCWAYGIDLSCASPTNSTGGSRRAGTAITPLHIVLAKHYKISNKANICFYGTGGEFIEREIEASEDEITNDIRVSILNTNLPPCIAPATILPDNYREYIGTGVGLPILMLDQDERAIVADLNSLPPNPGYSSGSTPRNTRRKLHYEDIIDGDSGNPVFLVFENEPIFLHALHKGVGGSGPFLTSYKNVVQAKLDNLSDDNRASHFPLQPFDFTSYPKLIREVK